MSDCPFSVGDCVGVYYLDAWQSERSAHANLDAVAVVEEIIKDRIIVVRDRRYARPENSDDFREFTNEGYTHQIIRPLSAAGKFAAEAELAERKRLSGVRDEISRLINQFSKTDPDRFLEHVKKFS